MSKRHNTILPGVRRHSALLQAYEQGYTPVQIKEAVRGTLSSEFKHPNMLDRYGIDLLTVEAVNIQRVRSKTWSSRLYDTCTQTRRGCLANYQDLCARVCALWLHPISDALSLYWSAVRLERSKGDLPLNDFAYEIFRNIGALIEGTLQIYLKEMLHIFDTAQGASTTFEQIEELGLGSVVQRLEFQCGLSLSVPPWHIPLNQWRNIAQHFSLKADGTAIRCVYGSRRQHTVEFSRQELTEVAQALLLLHSTFRTSHTIFFLDEADALSAHCKPFPRDDSDLLFQFSVGAASQGFEVTELDVRKERAAATLVDASDSEELSRAVHASQFGYQLWIATKADQIEITYRSKHGRRTVKSSIGGEDCKKVFEGHEPLEYLAKVAVFTNQKHLASRDIEPNDA